MLWIPQGVVGPNRPRTRTKPPWAPGYRLATGGATAEQLGQRYDYNRIILVGDTTRTFNSADGTTWGEVGTGVTFTSSLSAPVRIGPLLAGISTSSHSVDVDWFKIRLYVGDEPTAAAGTEETKP